jgi:hypothetical protein
MSSGVVIHHENWQFLDVARESYFAAAHRCLAQLQGDDSGTPDDTSDDPAYNGSEYTEKMAQCLTTAEANFPKESDIEIFFMPNETHHFRLRKLVVDGIKNAAEVDIAAHRFGSAYSEFNGTPDDETDDVESDGFISDLANRLAASDNPVQMRMVGDDDIYWLKPYGGDYSDGDEVGSNMAFERKNVDRLHRAGGDGERFEIRYLETNHGEHRLHHNKWLIFRGMADKPDAMLCGAANLTGTGFGDPESNYAPNFENIYWIRIPAVVQQYTEQMNRFWGVPGMGDTQDPPAATRPEEMPETDE